MWKPMFPHPVQELWTRAILPLWSCSGFAIYVMRFVVWKDLLYIACVCFSASNETEPLCTFVHFMNWLLIVPGHFSFHRQFVGALCVIVVILYALSCYFFPAFQTLSLWNFSFVAQKFYVNWFYSSFWLWQQKILVPICCVKSIYSNLYSYFTSLILIYS